MATTCGNLIDATLDFVLGGQDEEINVLAGAVDASTQTFTFSYDMNSIAPGAMLGVGLEVVRVMDVNATSKTATVLRGQRGSTAAAHSEDDLVQVAPRFSRWSVFRALNDDLESLASFGLWQVSTVELTFNASTMGYDMTGVTAVDDIYSVRYEVPGPTKEWPLMRPSEYRFERDADTTDFASGFSLTLLQPAYNGRKVLVAYRHPFTAFTSESSDAQTDAGLPASANRLPPLGAAIALMSGHEAGRLSYSTQPDTRRPDEVPAGSTSQLVREWERRRYQWIDEELARLHRRYPVRFG